MDIKENNQEAKQTKICARCHIEKDIKEFHKNATTKDGLHSWCKKCKNSYDKVKYGNRNNYPINMKTKICTKCKQEKPISEFYKDKRRKHGLHNYCKDCERGLYINNKEENKEKNRKRSEKYRNENHLLYLLRGCISRAKSKNISYDPAKELYKYLEPIYNLGRCMKCNCILEKSNKICNNSFTVDRINPNKGYLVDNVTILCNECNMKKQNNTYEDFKNWVKWYEMSGPVYKP